MLIVGAGIIGAAIAYFLQGSGARVTLIEASAPASGASGASDGAVSMASKRPGPMMQLGRASRGLYEQLARDGVLHDIYHRRPTYLIARSEVEADLVERQGEDLAAAGERVLYLSHDELSERVPGIGRHVLAGLKVPDDGHALGYRVVDRLLRSSGATLLRHTPVQALQVRAGRIEGVLTGQGLIRAGQVVVAAGLGSAGLAGLSEILVPRKGQLIVTDRATSGGAALPGPLMSAGYLAAKRKQVLGQSVVSLVIDPLTTGQFLIGSSRETGFTNRQTDALTVATILREALEVYPALAQQRVIRTFAGIRIGTSDGLPIVGPHPSVAGLYLATGMEGDGICLAPAIGTAVADMLRGERSRIDVSVLDPARLGELPLQARAGPTA